MQRNRSPRHPHLTENKNAMAALSMAENVGRIEGYIQRNDGKINTKELNKILLDELLYITKAAYTRDFSRELAALNLRQKDSSHSRYRTQVCKHRFYMV